MRDRKSFDVLVALGSNQSRDGQTPQELIESAVETLNRRGWSVTARSSLWRSPAWPQGSKSPDYMNAVCRIDTGSANAQATLAALHDIEDYYGRVRNDSNRWADRTLDLDLLDFKGVTIDDGPALVLPHPRLMARDFVLAPLLEIAPDWRHPLTGVAAGDALAGLARAGLATAVRVKAFPAG